VIVVETDILCVAVFATCASGGPAGNTSSTSTVEAIISGSTVIVDLTCSRSVLSAESVSAAPSRCTIRIGGTDVVVVKTDILRVAVFASPARSTCSTGNSSGTSIAGAVISASAVAVDGTGRFQSAESAAVAVVST
jgi:hypothetical protein